MPQPTDGAGRRVVGSGEPDAGDAPRIRRSGRIGVPGGIDCLYLKSVRAVGEPAVGLG